MDIHHCSGAILAGGFSSRMGADKAALPFGGMTLLEWQIQKLRALGIGDIMVSGSPLAAPMARCVPDVYPHRGPLSGIHACLEGAWNENVIFLAVDIPLVPASALRLLAEAHTGGITLLCHGGLAEPLVGVYATSLAEMASGILQTEDCSVRRLFAQTEVHSLAFQGDARLLENCNTPEAYQAAVRRAGTA